MPCLFWILNNVNTVNRIIVILLLFYIFSYVYRMNEHKERYQLSQNILKFYSRFVQHKTRWGRQELGMVCWANLSVGKNLSARLSRKLAFEMLDFTCFTSKDNCFNHQSISVVLLGYNFSL